MPAPWTGTQSWNYQANPGHNQFESTTKTHHRLANGTSATVFALSANGDDDDVFVSWWWGWEMMEASLTFFMYSYIGWVDVGGRREAKKVLIFFTYSYVKKSAMSSTVHLQPEHQTKNVDDFSHSPNFDHSEVSPLSWNGPAIVHGHQEYHEE